MSLSLMPPKAVPADPPTAPERGARPRSLVTLASSGASARMVNLLAAAQGAAGAASEHPFFRDPVLNTAILVRHRPRSDEAYVLPRGFAPAIKIILPLSRRDLAQGARVLFVGEPGWRRALRAAAARPRIIDADIALLELLDTFPTFDPFFLKGALAQSAFAPDDAYFALSPGDASAMTGFVAGRLAPLAARAGAPADGPAGAGAARLSEALIAADHSRLEPLRRTLGQDGEAFSRSAFSWRGHYYYAYALNRIARDAARIAQRLRAVRLPGGACLPEALRAQLAAEVRDATETCRRALAPYDAAFASLIAQGDAAPLRSALDAGPRLFAALGGRLGGLSDAAAYWRWRLDGDDAPALSREDADALLADFTPASDCGALA